MTARTASTSRERRTTVGTIMTNPMMRSTLPSRKVGMYVTTIGRQPHDDERQREEDEHERNQDHERHDAPRQGREHHEQRREPRGHRSRRAGSRRGTRPRSCPSPSSRLLLAVSGTKKANCTVTIRLVHIESERGLVQGAATTYTSWHRDEVALRERRDPEVLVERPVRESDVPVHEEELHRAVRLLEQLLDLQVGLDLGRDPSGSSSSGPAAAAAALVTLSTCCSPSRRPSWHLHRPLLSPRRSRT